MKSFEFWVCAWTLDRVSLGRRVARLSAAIPVQEFERSALEPDLQLTSLSLPTCRVQVRERRCPSSPPPPRYTVVQLHRRSDIRRHASPRQLLATTSALLPQPNPAARAPSTLVDQGLLPGMLQAYAKISCIHSPRDSECAYCQNIGCFAWFKRLSK